MILALAPLLLGLAAQDAPPNFDPRREPACLFDQLFAHRTGAIPSESDPAVEAAMAVCRDHYHWSDEQAALARSVSFATASMLAARVEAITAGIQPKRLDSLWLLVNPSDRRAIAPRTGVDPEAHEAALRHLTRIAQIARLSDEQTHQIERALYWRAAAANLWVKFDGLKPDR